MALIPKGRVRGQMGQLLLRQSAPLGCFKEYFKGQKDHSYFQQSLPPLKKTSGTVAVLTFGPICYHWMFDVLPRLALLEHFNSKVDKYVFNCHNLPFQQETLALLGIPKEKVITTHRRLHLQAKNLLVTFRGSYSWCMPLWCCQFLRDRFLVYKDPKQFPDKKRIFISREHARARKVLNEEEMMTLLRTMALPRLLWSL